MMGEGNAVGRGGLGAVLGAKNLKAVHGGRRSPVPVADRERFDRARADVLRLFRASPVIFGELGISEYGTPALVDLMRQRRMAPTENFRRTVFDGSPPTPARRSAPRTARKRRAASAAPSAARSARPTDAPCRSTRRYPTSGR